MFLIIKAISKAGFISTVSKYNIYNRGPIVHVPYLWKGLTQLASFYKIVSFCKIDKIHLV